MSGLDLIKTIKNIYIKTMKNEKKTYCTKSFCEWKKKNKGNNNKNNKKNNNKKNGNNKKRKNNKRTISKKIIKIIKIIIIVLIVKNKEIIYSMNHLFINSRKIHLKKNNFFILLIQYINKIEGKINKWK